MKPNRRFLVPALLFTLVATPAAAQPSPADQTMAEALFRDGRKLLNEDKVSEACAKFAESQRIAPALGTLLNLAVCHEREGKLASAWAEFSAVLSQAKRAGDQERQQYADEQIRSLEPRLPKLVVTADTVPEGFIVSIDQTKMGQGGLGSPLPVDPGEHQVAATAPKKQPWVTKVTVPNQPGVTTVNIPALADEAAAPATSPAAAPPPVTAEPAPTAKPTTTTPPEGDSGSGTKKTLGYVALGVGVVGVGVGSYFGLQTLNKKDDAGPYCPNKECSPHGMDLIEEARSTATISTVGFAVGLVGIAAGAWLLATSGSSEQTPGGDVALLPAVGREGGALLVRRTW